MINPHSELANSSVFQSMTKWERSVLIKISRLSIRNFQNLDRSPIVFRTFRWCLIGNLNRIVYFHIRKSVSQVYLLEKISTLVWKLPWKKLKGHWNRQRRKWSKKYKRRYRLRVSKELKCKYKSLNHRFIRDSKIKCNLSVSRKSFMQKHHSKRIYWKVKVHKERNSCKSLSRNNFRILPILSLSWRTSLSSSIPNLERIVSNFSSNQVEITRWILSKGKIIWY